MEKQATGKVADKASKPADAPKRFSTVHCLAESRIIQTDKVARLNPYMVSAMAHSNSEVYLLSAPFLNDPLTASPQHGYSLFKLTKPYGTL